jgi:hypothetical protein
VGRGSKVGGTTKVFDLSSQVDERFFVARERERDRAARPVGDRRGDGRSGKREQTNEHNHYGAQVT